MNVVNSGYAASINSECDEDVHGANTSVSTLDAADTARMAARIRTPLRMVEICEQTERCHITWN